MSKDKSIKKGSILHGWFEPDPGQPLHGQLHLSGSSTRLRLHDEAEIGVPDRLVHVRGVTADGIKVTCVDCLRTGYGHTMRAHHLDLFPHYLLTGDEHLEVESEQVRRITFTSTDMTSIFYDFDAFGTVIRPEPLMDSVLEGARKYRPVAVGEWPQVSYFTGRLTIIEVPTAMGLIRVSHAPTFGSGGPSGVSIKNQIRVGIEPDAPITFHEALRRLAVLRRFLSLAAGRPQRPIDVTIATDSGRDAAETRPLQLHWSYPPKRSKGTLRRPSPGDLPLDPIRYPDEFKDVLQRWVAKDEAMKTARSRFTTCLEKSSYTVDRLVAAANMFDLLPADEVPVARELPSDVAMIRDAALASLAELPDTEDRHSAMIALKMLGKPSLTKKVRYRWEASANGLESIFPDLDFVLVRAIRCRNHFVHGPSKSFKFERAEPFVPFLTDALEFVFAFSDLVASGWTTHRWATTPYGDGHLFTRFRWGYKDTLAAFQASMAGNTLDP
ncbi:hypothetical protein [Luteibacter sp. 3190]|uniref:ApeA N-terminal domain 1-containing protein n=1 Tax=Luteibacter sp. 3190 TaxID=2817736 RepID=UPI0028581873|nr:hypothetical protein [Luteibacter sp. 3190]MDR6935326.1 hypothetical protein [Luteibacter sp. 3190]